MRRMFPSARGLNEMEKSISRLVQKPLKKQSDLIIDRSAVLEVASKSWRDKNRLYPPFRRQRKTVFAQKDDRAQEIVEKSVSQPSKFRLSVCMRREQFPIACTNIPLVCDESTLNFRASDFPYSSSACGCDNEIPPMCGLRQHDAPCIEPICALQDDELYDITRGADRADDVCQDAVSAQDDKSDDVSVPSDKPDPHCYVTVCGESVDFVICGSEEEATLATYTLEDEASREDLGGEEALDIQEGEDESSGRSTSKLESRSELVSKSELLQDPLVSHRLTIPYEEMPPSRYCAGGSFNDSSGMKFLAKRPRSPVREIPDRRFDVCEGISEVTRRAEIHDAKYALRKSKEWIAKMITSDSTTSPTSGSSSELLTTFLKVLTDDVRLSLTAGESENDFTLTLATIWAITEFIMTEAGVEVMQSINVTNLGAVPKLKRSLSHNLTLLKAASFQRTSDVSYPPRGSDNHSLHRAIPWLRLCAAHAEGLAENYATVRTRIDEVTPDNEPKRPRAAYLPDVSCAHLEGMLSKKTVLPKNEVEEFEPGFNDG